MTIETKENIKDLDSYFEGVKSMLSAIENNFWLSGQIIITDKEWKSFKEDMLEIKVTQSKGDLK